MIPNRGTWLSNGHDNRTRACNAARLVSIKYSPMIEQAEEKVRTSLEREARARKELGRHRVCDLSLAASSERTDVLFSFASSVALAPTIALFGTSWTSSSDSLTGSYEPYAVALLNGLQATDGTNEAVSAVVTSVLAAASGIPASDYAVLAAAADLV